MVAIAKALTLLAMLASLAACELSKPTFLSSDITGASFGKGFELPDHTGQPRSLADYRGKAVVLFFGYTQCPDVCPTTLAELAAALDELGGDAQRVQVIFVTLDPERDTAEFLARYVTAFDPTFVAMRGGENATAKVAKEFKVFYQKQPGKQAGSYTMDHSTGTYVFDPNGRLRLLVSHGQGSKVFAHDLRELLKSSS